MTTEQRVDQAFFALSRKLTGNEWQGALPRHDLWSIVCGTEVFYLADGGYSRVAVDMATLEVFLCRGSSCDPTAGVLERWDSAQAERQALTDALRAWMKEVGGD